MTAVLKSQASTKVAQLVQKIEDRSDAWNRGLQLANFPTDVSVWGVLTQTVRLIEGAIQKYGFGSQRHREVMVNLSRSAPILLRWLYSRKDEFKPSAPRWVPKLRRACEEALWTTHRYEFFVSAFTMWHKDRFPVVVLSPNHLRFRTFDVPMQRRVRAYQQGVRVPGWPSTPDQPLGAAMVSHAEIQGALQRLVLDAEPVGLLGFRYEQSREALKLLYEIYSDRFREQFRRTTNFDLGGYLLQEYRNFFAALTAVCSIHEHLCFLWEQRCHRYPINSAVLSHTRSEWVQLLREITSLEESKVSLMLSDLTFGRIRLLDIYLQPFFEAKNDDVLLLVPQFILNSRAEENILRVCSYVRPKLYSRIQNAKESEMRSTLRDGTDTRRYKTSGPIKLPDPLPDIDLLVEDLRTHSLMIAELKWSRKTLRPVEHVDRDAEITKGIEQLKAIRDFLQRTPDFLRSRGLLASAHVAPYSFDYVVIARDHFVWTPPEPQLFVAEFDALFKALKEAGDLQSAVSWLRSYNWLPEENRDFWVRFEKATLNDVTVEMEVFHRSRV